MPLLEQALGIQEDRLGSDHPDVARTLSRIGELYQTVGRAGDARKAYQRALGILAAGERGVGPDHRDVAGLLMQLAGLARASSDPAEAQVLKERAETIYSLQEQAQASAALGFAARLDHQAGQRAAGDSPLTDPRYRRFHQILEQAADSLSRESGTRAAIGKSNIAFQLFERAVEIYEAGADSDDPALPSILETYGMMLRKAGRYRQAERVEQRAKRMGREK
jgi:tetratricopeptide (TPR) repeat protein